MPISQQSSSRSAGFTLIELIMVILILAVVAVFAIPRFADLQSDSRIAVIDGIAGSMRASISIVQSAARVAGLSPAATNPGGIQNVFLVTTAAGTAEVDWRNLCPESRAEGGDLLEMTDFISFPSSDPDFMIDVQNQSTRIGYDFTGCYVIYDSFACTVTTFTSSC